MAGTGLASAWKIMIINIGHFGIPRVPQVVLLGNLRDLLVNALLHLVRTSVINSKLGVGTLVSLEGRGLLVELERQEMVRTRLLF